MKPWHAIAAVVPAGLLLGLAGGHASRPEMQFHQAKPWPQSVREHGERIEAWHPIYEGGPQDLSPLAHSYRPDLDYSAFAMPPQDALFEAYDPAGDQQGDSQLLSASYEEDDAALTSVHRAAAEQAADRAVAAASEATEAAHEMALEQATPQLAKSEPVASTVPKPVAPIETEAF